MTTLRRTALRTHAVRSLALVAALSPFGAPLTAQGFVTPQVSLPSGDGADVAAASRNGDLTEALRRALGSEGDTLELTLTGSRQRGARSTSGEFVVTAERVRGGYELTVSLEMMKSVGMDFGAGLGIDLSASAGKSGAVVLGFDSRRSLGDALAGIDLMLKLDPAALEAELQRQLDRLAEKSDAAALAAAAVREARGAKDAAADIYGDAKKEFDKLLGKFKDADKALDKAKDKLRDAERELDKAWPISEVLKKALKAAEKVLDGAKKALNTAEKAKDAARKVMDRTSNALDKAKNGLDKAISKNDTVAAAVDAISTAVQPLREQLDRITRVMDDFAVRVVAIEVARKGGVEAAAGELGISVPRGELDWEADTALSARLRIEFNAGRSGDLAVSFAVTHEMGATVEHSAIDGRQAQVATTAELVAVYSGSFTRGFRYDRRASTASLEVDIAMVRVIENDRLGLESGVARSFSATLPLHRWSAGGGSAELSTTNRRDASITVRGESQRGATTFSFEGGLAASDVGRTDSMTVDFDAFASAVRNPQWVLAEVDLLAAACR